MVEPFYEKDLVDVKEVKTGESLKKPKKPKMDPVAAKFKNPIHQQDYIRKKEKYDKFFEDFSTEELKAFHLAKDLDKESFLKISGRLKLEMDRDFPNVRAATSAWQSETTTELPMLFKKAATVVESDAGAFVHPRDWSPYMKKYFKEQYAAQGQMMERQYIVSRAFNQAYMDKIGMKKVTLHRGTDGKTGRKIRDALRKHRQETVQMVDAPITGYSTSKSIAMKFGPDEGGIAVKVAVKSTDVVVHEDLLSLLNRAHRSEHEYIIKGGDRTIKLSDLTF